MTEKKSKPVIVFRIKKALDAWFTVEDNICDSCYYAGGMRPCDNDFKKKQKKLNKCSFYKNIGLRCF